MSPQPPGMLRRGYRCSVNSSFHALTLSATTGKIGEVSPPPASIMRDENRKVVLHVHPNSGTNAKSGGYVVMGFATSRVHLVEQLATHDFVQEVGPGCCFHFASFLVAARSGISPDLAYILTVFTVPSSGGVWVAAAFSILAA